MKHSDKPIVLCIEDEPGVLDALLRDLALFEDYFPLEAAESADAARELLQRPLEKGARLALVFCDHLMPGTSGTDFLVELNQDSRTAPTKKVLVTAQAGLEDAIRAVNDAGLDHFITKPWSRDQLHAVAKELLTKYLVEQGINPLPFARVLDPKTLSEAFRKNPPTDT